MSGPCHQRKAITPLVESWRGLLARNFSRLAMSCPIWFSWWPLTRGRQRPGGSHRADNIFLAMAGRHRCLAPCTPSVERPACQLLDGPAPSEFARAELDEPGLPLPTPPSVATLTSVIHGPASPSGRCRRRNPGGPMGEIPDISVNHRQESARPGTSLVHRSSNWVSAGGGCAISRALLPLVAQTTRPQPRLASPDSLWRADQCFALSRSQRPKLVCSI